MLPGLTYSTLFLPRLITSHHLGVGGLLAQMALGRCLRIQASEAVPRRWGLWNPELSP